MKVPKNNSVSLSYLLLNISLNTCTQIISSPINFLHVDTNAICDEQTTLILCNELIFKMKFTRIKVVK